MADPIRFAIDARLTYAGLHRRHIYRKSGTSGAQTKTKAYYVPQLRMTLDANSGGGYDDARRSEGTLQLAVTDPDIVEQIAALWWEHAMHVFEDAPGEWDDRARPKFRITIEQVME